MKAGEVPAMLQENWRGLGWVGLVLGGLWGPETTEVRGDLTREWSAADVEFRRDPVAAGAVELCAVAQFSLGAVTMRPIALACTSQLRTAGHHLGTTSSKLVFRAAALRFSSIKLTHPASFDGNDALALAGRLQSHFINMHNININDSEGYAITAVAVGAAVGASTATSQSGNTSTSRVNPWSYEGPRRPPSPQKRVAHPHRPRSLRSQCGRGRILIVPARRQQTYAWGVGCFLERARFADPRPALTASPGAMGAIGPVGVRPRVDDVRRWEGTAYITEKHTRTSRSAIYAPSKMLSFLRAVGASEECALVEDRAQASRNSVLAVDSDGKGAFEFRGPAMQLARVADDEIPEDNVWSWWPAAVRRRLQSLQDTTGAVSNRIYVSSTSCMNKYSFKSVRWRWAPSGAAIANNQYNSRR
ncbi:hypothetical protein DFH09DRAFT_1090358 [Mycena vulgaris]|nr:hypothetical protein DFH09DRAFT_1090358 [Mycena vulgaris]